MKTAPARVVCLILLFLLAGALLKNGVAQDSAAASVNPLYVDPATQDFNRNPVLLDRILSDPHGYFRFINIPFSNEVCRRFELLLIGAPSLNLHGDAHLEQYAVTDLGRGLTDFDDSSTGPGMIDLMRFGVSLRLACTLSNWEHYADSLFDVFLTGYFDALEDPTTMPEEPSLVSKIQSGFKTDRAGYLEWVASLMIPMPDGERDSLLIAMEPYVQAMLLEDSELEAGYFEVEQSGYLKMGIGSALDKKYLVRVKGLTSNPNDDVILELKEVRDISGIDCINSGQRIDPFRILLGQARIAYEPFRFLGYFRFRDKNFWVHSWVDHYKEVSIIGGYPGIEQLAQVAYDVGVQLGRGHVKHIAAPFDLQLRQGQLMLIKQHEDFIRFNCVDLAQQTIDAWKQFSKKMTEHKNN